MIKKAMMYAVLVFLTAQFSGCAAAWFAGGAATGAVAQHHIDEHHK